MRTCSSCTSVPGGGRLGSQAEGKEPRVVAGTALPASRAVHHLLPQQREDDTTPQYKTVIARRSYTGLSGTLVRQYCGRTCWLVSEVAFVGLCRESG